MDDRRVCVIGAGACGIIAAKTLQQRGIPYDCFEKGSGIGGLWRYNNDNGLSAAYKSLHINSSRKLMAFSDFPMPSSYPDFPHHSHILEYYENYVEHFGIRDHIRFETTVEEVIPTENGYRVRITQGALTEERTYASVIVANGHHWSPRKPEFTGEFNGESFHSFHYKTTEGLEDKRVLVVGIGNSGCDIASEVSRVAEKTWLSTRRGAHIIPKYIFGQPLDRVSRPFMWNYLPFRLFQRLFGAVLRISRGRLTRFGLPEPTHRVLEEHPTVAADLLNLIGHGRISVKPNVHLLSGDQVVFTDGSAEDVDVIIYATGYDIRFPFLDPAVLNPENNEVPLYKRVAAPSHPGLYFVGLVQPWGPLNPLSEAQSEWIADLIGGQALLPSETEMRKDIRKERQRMQKRYANSIRHTIQVDFHPYLKQLRQVRKQCQRLARRANLQPEVFPLPQSGPTQNSNPGRLRRSA
ncbi:MAG: NAD(P)-binding domain-containing protein [Fuerstiella sp.]